MRQSCEWLAGAVGVLLVGCGPQAPPAQPTTGLVRVDGQPTAGVELVFLANDPPAPELLVPTPRGFSEANGSLVISTYAGGDGLPAGEYRVTAVLMDQRPDGVDPEEFESKDRLGGSYADPDQSGLTATIVAGNNELPTFELSAKRK